MKIFTKSSLLSALKVAGLPHSYKWLLKAEKEGLIPRDNEIGVNNHRFYTEDEIKSIVSKVKKYNDGKK